MFIEPIFVTVLVGTVFLLVLLLTIVVTTQLFIFRKFSEVKRSNEHLRVSLTDEEGKILKKARLEAEEIVSKALRQAAKIEKRAEINKRQISELLQERINEVLQNTTQKIQSVLNNITQDYQKSLGKELQGHLQRLAVVSKDFEEQNLKAMAEELARQKDTRLKSLEEKIYQITREAAFEILEGSINLPLHEELIAEAVEKAVEKEGL